MKIICPHCNVQQKRTISILIHPTCNSCGQNMTRFISKKYLSYKWIARFLALIPFIFCIDSPKISSYILGLLISFVLFAIIELLFFKVAHKLKK